MKNIIKDEDEYFSECFDELMMSGEEVISKEFEDCTFTHCDFSDANFKDCKFIDCDFIDCNLSLVRVANSRFNNVAFRGCKAIGIDWSNAHWPQVALSAPMSFKKCIISESSFMDLTLKEVVIEACKAHDVDFRGADLSEANFTYSELNNSLFNKTNLSHANFSEATDYTIDIYLNELKGAIFTRYEAVNLLQSIGIQLVE